MFTFILEHCGFDFRGKLTIPPQNLTNTNSSMTNGETLFNSFFHAGIWSGFSFHRSCANSHNYCDYSCKLPCSFQKTLFHFGHLAPLYLLFLCPPFHNDPWPFGGQSVVYLFYLGLNLLYSLFLCTLASCEFVLIVIYCKQKVLWWCLNDALIHVYNDNQLGAFKIVMLIK